MMLTVLLAVCVFSLNVRAEESVPAENSLLELKGKVEDVIKNKGLTCYVCTSYLPQCNGTVDNTHKWVPHMHCKGKCFVRIGEEKERALYRGCTDGWNKVDELDFDYVGCRNHTWNGMSRLWCLCDSDRCNGDSLNDLAGFKASAPSYSDDAPAVEYPIKAVEKEEVLTNPKASFKDYNHAYENVAYSNEDQQYYAGNTYDDVNYGDNTQYDEPEIENKAAIQEDKQDYVIQDTKEKPKEKQAADYPEPDYSILLRPEETKLKSRPYRSHNYQNQEGKNYKQADYVDTQGHDYPLYTDEKSYEEHKQDTYKDGDSYKSRGKLIPKPYWQPLYPDPNSIIPGSYYPYGFQEANDYVKHRSATEKPVVETTSKPTTTTEKATSTSHYFVGQGSNTDHPIPGEKVFCSETGYFQHPHDCSAFIACVIDDHVGKPVMNHMRCPTGLFWDNDRHICDHYSFTCKDSAAQQKAKLIEIGDYGKDYYEAEEPVKDDKNIVSNLEESQGYEELHEATIESEKSYFH